MLTHGFSDNTPIEEIVQSCLGLDIKGKPLETVLEATASEFDTIYSNLQPTTAQFTSALLTVKFRYLLTRVIDLYEMDE